MISEEDKYKLLWDTINELGFINKRATLYLTELEEKIKSKEFQNLRLGFKIEKWHYRIYSFLCVITLFLFSSKFPLLNHNRFNLYETTAYTYVNGEYIDTPVITYERDLGRERIVYLDKSIINENGSVDVYRYDLTNKTVKDIKEYNLFYLDQSSKEFLAKLSTSHYTFDNMVTIITQNKEKYVFDNEKYEEYKHEYFRFLPLFSSLLVLSYLFGNKRYNEYKKSYMKVVNDLYERYISFYINYKDYYKYLYEDLKKDLKSSSKLDLANSSFSNCYGDASEIEETCQEINKLLRK